MVVWGINAATVQGTTKEKIYALFCVWIVVQGTHREKRRERKK